MTSSLTDAVELIESAFDDFECIAETERTEHGGDRRAYVIWHTCRQGFLCETHYKDVTEDLIPRAEMEVNFFGFTRCGYCGLLFTSRKSMFTVYPL